MFDNPLLECYNPKRCERIERLTRKGRRENQDRNEVTPNKVASQLASPRAVLVFFFVLGAPAPYQQHIEQIKLVCIRSKDRQLISNEEFDPGSG